MPDAGDVTRLVPLSGRDGELAELDASFAEVAAGRCAVAVVRGFSGIGKSALIRHYIRELERRDDVLCFSGRCASPESGPHNVMSGLIDAVASELQRRPTEVAALVPERPESLLRLFPVLGRIPAIAAAVGPEIRDPLELRMQGFGAMRQLLRAMAMRRRLVLVLDDAHWLDEHTVELLCEVLRPPEPPALLLLLSARDDPARVIAPGSRLRRTGLERLMAALGAPVRDLSLGPLPLEASIQLANALLGATDDPLAARVAREAAGNPFSVGELCRYFEAAPERGEHAPSVDDVVRERIGELPAAARRLLECCAVNGGPLSHRVAAFALACTPDELTRDLRRLRAARLVSTSADLGSVEPAHDRIQRSVLARLDGDARRALHRALAEAMGQQEETDAERLAWHWRCAGETRRAAELARIAAEAAERAVDFERAADLYRMVLELGELPADDVRGLRTALGAALSNAGRPVEAAAAFEGAALGAGPATRLDLRNRAAGELLRGGHVREGIEAIRAILGEVGLGLARTPWRALWSIAWRRMWMRLRGLGWRVRSASEVPRDVLIRLDLLYSVSLSLAIVDNIRGADYQARHMLLALQVGEPSRLGRAFGLDAGYLVSVGRERRTRRVAEFAYELRKEHGALQGPFDRWAQGGIHYFLENSWRAAVVAFDTVEAELRDGYHDRLALDMVQVYGLFARLYMGDLPGLARLVPALAREADRRGDLYASVNLRTRLNVVWLMRDDPDGAERDLHDAIEAWQPVGSGYQVQHYWALVSRCELALYRGDPALAGSLLDAELRALRKSLLPMVPMVRLEIDHLRGRIGLAQAQASTDQETRRAMLGQVTRDARRLERLQPPLAGMLALLLRGGVAHLSGDRARAIELLRRAVRWLDRTETMLYGRPALRALGIATGGEEGARLIADADAAFAVAEVDDPAAMTQVFVPGFER